MGVTTNSKMKKANLVDLIYKNFKDHFTKTEYRKLVPNIPFKDNIFVRQGFGDE